jgi:hypothetical protein
MAGKSTSAVRMLSARGGKVTTVVVRKASPVLVAAGTKCCCEHS